MGMGYINFPKILRKRELEAYRIEELEIKKGSKSKKLSNLYNGIGKDCEERGFLDKAILNYKDALKFALEDDRIKIGKKLNDLKQRRKEVPNFFGKNKGGLEKKFVFATLSMISLVFALFFSAFSLTGYSISGLNNESFRFGGVILFFLGLVFAFFYFKGKK